VKERRPAKFSDRNERGGKVFETQKMQTKKARVNPVQIYSKTSPPKKSVHVILGDEGVGFAKKRKLKKKAGENTAGPRFQKDVSGGEI